MVRSIGGGEGSPAKAEHDGRWNVTDSLYVFVSRSHRNKRAFCRGLLSGGRDKVNECLRMMLPVRPPRLLMIGRHTSHTACDASGLARDFSARLPQSDQTPGPLFILNHLASFFLYASKVLLLSSIPFLSTNAHLSALVLASADLVSFLAPSSLDWKLAGGWFLGTELSPATKAAQPRCVLVF